MRKVLLLLFIAAALAPMVLMVSGSLTANVFQMPPRLIPRELTLDHYRQFTGIGLWAMNTGIAILIGVTLSMAITCAAGYVFAFHTFPFKRVLWLLLLAGITVPRLALMIPKFSVLSKLGLIDTRAGFILSQLLLPQSVYLARTFFETIPPAIRDAAKIDGLGELSTLMRIVVPLSKPIIACVMVFASTQIVGDYLWQAVVLGSPEKYTLVVGLMRSIARGPQSGGNMGQELASGVLMMIPILLVFFVASKYFVGGMTGAVKE